MIKQFKNLQTDYRACSEVKACEIEGFSANSSDCSQPASLYVQQSVSDYTPTSIPVNATAPPRS